MANLPSKHTNDRNSADTWKHNWEVMKPFVHFAIKAMAIIGSALISIIKLLPALAEHKKQEDKKDKRVIKI